MDSKYYTPDETEYHIGFEYQSLTDERFPDNDESWSNEIIASIKDLRDVCHYLIVDDFIEHRVKYLDREDIESLGWDFCGKNFDSASKEDVYRLYNNDDFKTEKYQLCVHPGYKIVIKFNGLFTIFCGTIKNKSELKKLLTQLNII